MKARGITVVGASAGSGKTFRLTKVVADAIDPAGEAPLGLEGLVAVTYTRKAHAELASRIRQKLVSAGAFEEALRLPLAYLGTVHSACLRLVQEFALDGGVSPNVDVVTGSTRRLLAQALDAALPLDARTTLDELARRCRLGWSHQTRRWDWVGPVADVMELARSNRIPAEALSGMAERAVAGLLALLPPVEADGPRLDGELELELAAAVQELARLDDGTAGTTSALAELRQLRRRAAPDEGLVWADWHKLAWGVKATRAADPALDRLRAVARRYEAHPRFHADLRALTRGVYVAAAFGMSAYQDWKRERQLVDFVDLLDRALDLVDEPTVAGVLADRLRLAVVDEFQDTSPIQLALFVRLHRLAGRSVWVGDRKQCIFEYAGADPRLMDDVARWVAGAGGEHDALVENHRSRPELVELSSELFTRALARHGFGRAEVAVRPRRASLAGLAALPPLGVFVLGSKSADGDAEAVAAGVVRLLARPEDTPVLDRVTGEVRPARAGDVAVLVATNAEARELAAALYRRGTRAAVARPGLLATPEGVLVDCALRWLLDRDDALAEARLDALLEFGGAGPDAWLEGRLARAEARRARRAETVAPEELVTAADLGSSPPLARAAEQRETEAASGWQRALVPLRSRLAELAPTEAVDEILRALDAVRLAQRWPDPTQRLANLDALRALAVAYEERCSEEREAGTVAGLLRFFDDLTAERIVQGESLAADDQHVPADEGAVTVTTYHRAKGLEWPIVVLASLHRQERRTAFEVTPESERAEFDPEAPLAGRWIRFWPWPLGGRPSGPLATAAEASAEGQRVQAREEQERARLLYVGFTRARDHLVLAVRARERRATKKVPAGMTQLSDWLDTLASVEGAPLLALPVDAADGAVAPVRVADAAAVAARVWHLAGERPAEETPPAGSFRAFVRPAPRGGDPAGPARAYAIRPSSAQEDWPDLVLPTVADVLELPAAMPVDRSVASWNILGDAVHAFLACDAPELPAAIRTERATRIVAAHGLAGHLRPDALIAASDRLATFVAERWPEAVWHREISLGARVPSPAGERRLVGTIDLLLELPDGFVLVDHKTFPGRTREQWRKKAVEVLPQLAAYARGLSLLRGKPVREAWVHLPVGGGMVRIVT